MQKDDVMIYRQAAINALENTECELLPEEWDELTDAIMNVPSAQPDIIHCKDCKHFEYDHPYIIQGVPVLGHEVCSAWGDGCKTDANGYCFLAERRTDEGD